eukprot:255301_1
MNLGKPLFFIVCGCSGLYGGYWQTQRREAKIAYLDLMKKRINAKPVPCPTTLTADELDERKLQRVFVEGIPDFKNEVVVGTDKPPPSSGINAIEYDWAGYVYTPITLKCGNTVLLNRGWIKEDDALECPEPKQTDSKYQKFYGLLTPLQFVPEQIEPFDVAKIFWPFIHRLSINTRWANMNIPSDQVPVVVTVTDPKAQGNKPVRWKEKDFMAVKTSVSTHTGYIIFWYSMCAISWFYAYTFFRNPAARRVFKRRLTSRPVLRRTDVMERQRERDLSKPFE